MLLVVYFHGKSKLRATMSNQLELRNIYGYQDCTSTDQMNQYIQTTNISRSHINTSDANKHPIIWLSCLTCIIRSNHFKDYCFIITYLSKLHTVIQRISIVQNNNFFCLFLSFFGFFLSNMQCTMLLLVLKLWLLLLR